MNTLSPLMEENQTGNLLFSCLDSTVLLFIHFQICDKNIYLVIYRFLKSKRIITEDYRLIPKISL